MSVSLALIVGIAAVALFSQLLKYKAVWIPLTLLLLTNALYLAYFIMDFHTFDNSGLTVNPAVPLTFLRLARALELLVVLFLFWLWSFEAFQISGWKIGIAQALRIVSLVLVVCVALFMLACAIAQALYLSSINFNRPFELPRELLFGDFAGAVMQLTFASLLVSLCVVTYYQSLHHEDLALSHPFQQTALIAFRRFLIIIAIVWVSRALCLVQAIREVPPFQIPIDLIADAGITLTSILIFFGAILASIVSFIYVSTRSTGLHITNPMAKKEKGADDSATVPLIDQNGLNMENYDY